MPLAVPVTRLPARLRVPRVLVWVVAEGRGQGRMPGGEDVSGAWLRGPLGCHCDWQTQDSRT